MKARWEQLKKWIIERQKPLTVIGMFLIIILANIFDDKEDDSEENKILIIKAGNHPGVNKTAEGVIDALNEEGYPDYYLPVGLRAESVQANLALATQTAFAYIKREPEVAIGIGSKVSEELKRYSQGKVNVVFSSVTYPEKSGLTEKQNKITGVSNFVKLRPQLEIIKKLQPNISSIGMIYNAHETGSAETFEKMKALCEEEGITLISETIHSKDNVFHAVSRIKPKVEAFFVGNDNAALSALDIMISTTKSDNIPVYVSDIDAVEYGALAALGHDQYEIGRKAGKMAARVLDGEDINNISIEEPDTEPQLYINSDMAETLGITIPEDLKEKATFVKQAEKKWSWFN